MLVLVASDPAQQQQPRGVQTVIADNAGRFRIGGLHPGGYMAVARESEDSLEDLDLDELVKNPGRGEAVELYESAHQSIQLKIASAAGA